MSPTFFFLKVVCSLSVLEEIRLICVDDTRILFVVWITTWEPTQGQFQFVVWYLPTIVVTVNCRTTILGSVTCVFPFALPFFFSFLPSFLFFTLRLLTFPSPFCQQTSMYYQIHLLGFLGNSTCTFTSFQRHILVYVLSYRYFWVHG